jgi:ribonuclease-3
LGVPAYVVSSTGPEHDKHFTARAVVNDEDYGQGEGRTKKEAEQQAAAAAYKALEELEATSAGRDGEAPDGKTTQDA